MSAHKNAAPKRITLGVITCSSTRTLAEDKGGNWICRRAVREGCEVVRHVVVPDDALIIAATVRQTVEEFSPHGLIVTGGTGITEKDVTIEAVRPLFQKELSAFGVLFAHLSFEEIDSAALLSRATAGIVGKTAVFCIPGSLNACKMACKNLIFPELGHLAAHIHGKA